MSDAAERKAQLIEEFDRLKERANWLDRMNQGHADTWATLRAMIPDGTELVIDKLVTEARQTATALATLAKSIASLGEDEVPVVVKDPLEKIQDDLAKRRAAKAV